MQQRYLLSEEKRGPKSIARIIAYTIVIVLASVFLYTLTSILAFIFLVWFTINGDIKPLLKIAHGVSKPIHSLLIDTKLKTHTKFSGDIPEN
jgi:hypothetical protein